MRVSRTWRLAALAAVVVATTLPACRPRFPNLAAWRLSEKQCLVRAMYFESIRSSDDGLFAVGTVVMNRVASPQFPNTICGVVGQPGQFADGVLTRPMLARHLPRIERIADALLAGYRHPGVGRAMFFHTAGLSFPYDNMHYVLIAGGNAFYEKRSTRR